MPESEWWALKLTCVDNAMQRCTTRIAKGGATTPRGSSVVHWTNPFDSPLNKGLANFHVRDRPLGMRALE